MKNKESGSFLISSIFLVLLLQLALVCSLSLSQKIQNRIALIYRLELCAITAAKSRATFYRRIAYLNRRMRELRITIYASRNAKYIAPISVPAAVTEKVALHLIRGHQIAQEVLVSKQTAKESPIFHCKQNKYSKQIALCARATTKRSNFKRSKTIYSDVPGNLHLKRIYTTTKFHCAALHQKTYLRQSTQLKVDAAIKQKKYNYEYSI